MSSKTADRRFRTAAWRISLWGALTFALGTTLIFGYVQSYFANDLQKHTDSWLTGELAVLADVAQRTPDDQLHDAVIREVAELASREAPHADESPSAIDRTVFFLMTDADYKPLLHTGAGQPYSNISSILRSRVTTSVPRNVLLPGFDRPFRVAEMDLSNRQHIYLGFSTLYESKVLSTLRIQFVAIWFAMILLGSGILFVTTRSMLQRVQAISNTAAQIGRDNLAARVPVSERNDEISYLSVTFNQMLDRIQAAVQQLHTMTDAIAHDLRSPITAIRGRLELALMEPHANAKEETLASSIEELDRLTSLLDMSLDVSEANADALKLHKQPFELQELVRDLVNLYEPVFAEAGLTICLRNQNQTSICADAALLQRVIFNLFDNEVRHLSPARTVTIAVERRDAYGVLTIEDDGPGFSEEILPVLFEPYVKRKDSPGHGLGLAFVAAIVRAHQGRVTATNKPQGGASIAIELPSFEAARERST